MRMAESEYFRYNLKVNMWEGLQQYAISATTPARAPTGTPRNAPPTPTP